jgi:Raf kinase inhibitor-like YbhB/YbcL family protein
MNLTSAAFDSGQPIPARHTCDGESMPPPLEWTDVPARVKAFVLIVDDPDAPRGTFTHWLLCDVAPNAGGLGGRPPSDQDGIAGRNDFGEIGYGAPCPPRGHGVHRYHFRLYALDRLLGLKPGFSRRALETAMNGRVLDSAVLVGRYERR